MFKVKNFKENNNKLPILIKALVAFVIFALIVFLIYPYWPKVQYYFTSILNKQQDIPISYALLNTESAKNEETIKVDSQDTQQNNVLTIPKIGVKTNILEGDSLDILKVEEGVWREPNSSTPLVAGNMVIAGHRFQYLPPNTNTFYNLEEMKIGDDIYINWDGKIFVYRVYNTMLVNPDQVEIRNGDPDLVREITLYTCTPLYTSDRRFVVKASLIGYE